MATVTKQTSGGGSGKTPPAKKREPSLVQKTLQYFKESWAETKRATWPSWIQIRQLTIAVVACILFVTLYIFVWDQFLAWLTKGLYKT